MGLRNTNLKQWSRIAWRNITRQRKRTFLLAGAIAFAVFVITVVNGYTGGLVDAVRENFTQTFGGHIYISGSVLSPSGRQVDVLRDTDILVDAISAADLDVEEINYRSRTLANLIYTTSEALQIVDGVDFAAEAQFRETIRLVEGSWEAMAEPGSILLPAPVVEQLDVTLGEQILLSVTTITGQRNVIELTLAGIAAEVAGLGISSAYVQLADLNAAIGLAPGEYQTANLRLYDPDETDAATDRLVRELSIMASVYDPFAAEEGRAADMPMRMMRQITGAGGRRADESETWTGTRFEVSNINDTTDQLETVIGTLNIVAFVIFLVLLVITAVGITNSYRMVMMERTQEIGTMRAIGVKQVGIRWVFTLEALIVALIGTIGGLALSGIVTTAVGLIEWSASTALNAFLVRGHLQASISFFAIVRNVAAILIMTVWAVNAPAKAASRLGPAHALRTTY